MIPRTGRWVERGLLSPPCGPRLGQSLSGGGVYVTSVPAWPCSCAGRAKRGRLPGLPWGRGLPLSLHSPPPAAGGWWLGWPVACVLGPRGNPPHGPLERGRKGRTCNQGVRYLLLLPFRALTLGS